MQADELASEILNLWDFGDPAESERRFRALLARVEEDAEAAAIVRTQVARAQGLQRRFDEAHKTLDAVETMPSTRGARVAVRLDARARAHLPLRRGSREGAPSTSPSRSIAPARPARTRSPSTPRTCWRSSRPIPRCRPRGTSARSRWPRARRDPLARRWRASLLNNMGWTRHGEGRFEEALDLFTRALAARESMGDAASTRVARWCVARALRSLGRVDEALAAQQALEAEIAEAGAPADGFVCEEIAECLVALGRAGEAKPWFARAHAELAKDPWFVEAEPARLAHLLEASR